MVVFYLDTSMLVKRYHEEEGTDLMDELFDRVIGDKRHSLTTSTLTSLELFAAMRRAVKGGLITEDYFHSFIGIYSKEQIHLTYRPLSDDTMVEAMDVIMDHGLRSADAIQLATALETRKMMRQLDEDVVLVADDLEMKDAARKEGLVVITKKDRGVFEDVLVL